MNGWWMKDVTADLTPTYGTINAAWKNDLKLYIDN
jgi:hypothetical protein